MCAEWLGGGPGRPARPLFITHVDTSQPDPIGLLELGLRGKAPRIPAATLEILSRDADFRAIMFDRRRPLAVSDKLHAKKVPTDIEIAVRARDLGCRLPGSRDPLAYTDNHHLGDDRPGRTHDPDLVVRFSRRNHKIVHEHGWNVTLDPVTAQVAIRRRGRRWRSLPRGTPLARPPNGTARSGGAGGLSPPRLSDDRAPPGMPF